MQNLLIAKSKLKLGGLRRLKGACHEEDTVCGGAGRRSFERLVR